LISKMSYKPEIYQPFEKALALVCR